MIYGFSQEQKLFRVYKTKTYINEKINKFNGREDEKAKLNLHRQNRHECMRRLTCLKRRFLAGNYFNLAGRCTVIVIIKSDIL